MEGLRHSILGWFSHWFSLHVSCLHIWRHPPCRTSPLREKRSSQCAGNFGTSTESPRAQRRRNLSLKMQLFWWNKSWPRYTQAVSTDEPILRLQQTFENLGGETERIFKKCVDCHTRLQEAWCALISWSMFRDTTYTFAILCLSMGFIEGLASLEHPDSGLPLGKVWPKIHVKLLAVWPQRPGKHGRARYSRASKI